MTLEMRDSYQDAWEVQERFNGEMDASIALAYYSDHPSFTGVYWRLLKGNTIIDSGKFR
jgi:hypothetical protein